MQTADLDRSLPSLFSELVFGSSNSSAFVLNQGDRGLLASIDGISADEASRVRDGGGSAAAHVRHLTYGLSLLNRWTANENPFQDADWSAAWRQNVVTDAEWTALRSSLRHACEQWRETLRSDRRVSGPELDGVIASIVHLAYHFGAMRQIAPALRGPRAEAS